jgi:hypothetical protein
MVDRQRSSGAVTDQDLARVLGDLHTVATAAERRTAELRAKAHTWIIVAAS